VGRRGEQYGSGGKRGPIGNRKPGSDTNQKGKGGEFGNVAEANEEIKGGRGGRERGGERTDGWIGTTE